MMTFFFTGGERVILREIIKTQVMVRRYAATAHSIMQKLELRADGFADEGHIPVSNMEDLDGLEAKLLDATFAERIVSNFHNSM